VASIEQGARGWFAFEEEDTHVVTIYDSTSGASSWLLRSISGPRLYKHDFSFGYIVIATPQANLGGDRRRP
jgi:hypothetical protein